MKWSILFWYTNIFFNLGHAEGIKWFRNHVTYVTIWHWSWHSFAKRLNQMSHLSQFVIQGFIVTVTQINTFTKGKPVLDSVHFLELIVVTRLDLHFSEKSYVFWFTKIDPLKGSNKRHPIVILYLSDLYECLIFFLTQTFWNA